MSTNSYIGVRRDDGDVEYIYCHWDGNISWNGKALLKYFNDKDRAQQLVDLGDISALNVEAPEEESTVGKFVDIFGCTVEVYTGSRAGRKHFASSAIELANNRGSAEFIYVYDENWWVACRDTDWEFEELTDWVDVEESVQRKGRMLKESTDDREELKFAVISDLSSLPSDIVPKCLRVLKEYGPDIYKKLVDENPELLNPDSLDDNEDGQFVYETMDELFKAMTEIAPEGFYFDSHPDNGGCYGFWPYDDEEWE